jgi:endonuclease/exonuclease/phosphatase family metal-dependent hydrolase
VGRSGPKKQKTQDEALWLWAKKRFQQNTNANLVIFGDFNETKPPGDSAQGVAVLLQPGSPLHDAFEFSKGIVRTHANGNAYDRILISDSVVKGSAGLKFVGISVHEHDKGKGADRLWFTDHFPVTARLISY